MSETEKDNQPENPITGTLERPAQGRRSFVSGAIVLAAAGIFFLVIGIMMQVAQNRMKKWLPAKAVISKSDIDLEGSQTNGMSGWGVSLTYEYAVSGSTFRGNDRAVLTLEGEEEKVKAEVEKTYAPGKSLQIYFSPEDNSISYAQFGETNFTDQGAGLNLTAAVVMFVFAGVLLRKAFRSSGTTAEVKKEDS